MPRFHQDTRLMCGWSTQTQEFQVLQTVQGSTVFLTAQMQAQIGWNMHCYFVYEVKQL